MLILQDPASTRDVLAAYQAALPSEVTSLPFDVSDLILAAETMGHHAHLLSEGKAAFLAPRDLLFGMTRMFLTLTEDLDYPMAAFRTRDGAVSWLAGEEAQCEITRVPG